MPAEQRVISIGFIAIGLAILGVLYALFGRGESVTGTLEALNNDLYPRFVKAMKQGNYPNASSAAEEIVDALNKGGRATIQKSLAVQATERDPAAQALSRMVEKKVFERAANGEFLFDEIYYPAPVHAALTELRAIVDAEFKTLGQARRLAAAMSEALDVARTGSGKPLAVPAAAAVKGTVPGLDKNPLLEHDAALYAVYAVDPQTILEALQSPDPGGRATSSRLRWNQTVPKGTIARDLANLKQGIRELHQVAARFSVSAEIVEEYPNGPAAAKKIYATACDKIAVELAKSVRAEFEAQRAQYEKGPVIAAILRAEAEILTKAEQNIDEAAKAFGTKFAE